MLRIVNGSFEKLKAEMKHNQEIVKRQIKQLEKERKQKKYLTESEQKRLQALEKLFRLYTPSKVLPVRIEGTDLIIDSKIYQSFMKKIKGFSTGVMVLADSLHIRYRSGFQSQGYIEFYNLSPHFAKFQNIPVAVIKDGSES